MTFRIILTVIFSLRIFESLNKGTKDNFFGLVDIVIESVLIFGVWNWL